MKHRNWLIVVSFFVMFLAHGGSFYILTLLISNLSDIFSWGRGTVSLAFACYFAMSGLFSMITARWVKNYQIKNLLIIGILFVASGFAWLSVVGKVWQLVMSFALIGIGSAMGGTVTISELLSRHFIENLGTALGVSSLGIGASGMIAVPVVEKLISAYGWKYALVVTALFIFLLGFLIVYSIVSKDKGACKNQETSNVLVRFIKNSLPAGVGSRAHYAKEKNFWLMASVIFFASAVLSGILAHLIIYLTDLGYRANEAATVMALVAGLGMAGKIIFGKISDFVGVSRTLVVQSTMEAGGLAIMYFIGKYFPLLIAFIVIFGFSMGGQVPLFALWPREIFSKEDSIMALGTLLIPSALGSCFGPVLIGYLFEFTGSYYLPLVAATIIMMINSLLIGFLCFKRNVSLEYNESGPGL